MSQAVLAALGLLAGSVAIAGAAPAAPASGPKAAPAPAAKPAGAATAPAADAAAAARAFEGAPRADLRFPGGRSIHLTIADTPERVTFGYMFHTEVKDDEGMLFAFDDPGPHYFWMKNTLVPLDMIWLDDAFGVLFVQPWAAPCKAGDACPPYGPRGRSSYVLEVRGGTAGREGLKPGDHLAISVPNPGGGS